MRLAVRSSTLRLRQLRLQLRRQSRALLHVLHRIPDAQELPHAQLIHESIAACFWRGRCVPLCERERENPPSAEGSARRCGFHRDQELRRQLAECTQHLRCTRVIVSRCVGRRDVLRAVAATREPQLGRAQSAPVAYATPLGVLSSIGCRRRGPAPTVGRFRVVWAHARACVWGSALSHCSRRSSAASISL